MRFQAMVRPSTVAFDKDAFPSADTVAGESSFSLPIQALLCCVGIQAQYQAFVRFAALRAGAAFCQPSRSTGPAFWNLYPARLSLESVGFRPYYYGACADVVPGT